MPNYCNYEMLVRGKKENLIEFFNVMNCDYDYMDPENPTFSYKRHMYRIFEAESEYLKYSKEDGRIIPESVVFDGDETDLYDEIIIHGYCAWSVSSCMLPDTGGYYDDNKGRDRHTNLIKESRLLNLDIELFSDEGGMMFMEHYVIKRGILEVSESRDYEEIEDKATGEFEQVGGFSWEYTI